MKIATRSVEWTISSGTLKATFEVSRGKKIEIIKHNLDGEIFERRIVEFVETTKTIISLPDGRQIEAQYLSGPYSLRLTEKNPKGATDVCFSKDKICIPIMSDKVKDDLKQAYKQAILEAETDNEEWRDILRQRGELKEYDDHCNRVDSMMTLNGKTY